MNFKDIEINGNPYVLVTPETDPVKRAKSNCRWIGVAALVLIQAATYIILGGRPHRLLISILLGLGFSLGFAAIETLLYEVLRILKEIQQSQKADNK